jgi:acetyltransferase-like isoleucine patch superfamily enzyme
MKYLIPIIRLFRRKNNPVKYYRQMGVVIGSDCRLLGNISFGSEPYLVKLGNHVSITNSNFITHDGGVWVFRKELPLIDVIKPIIVGNNVFIGSNCTIMPGIIIGDNVIVGAGSIVTKNLESNSVYAGVPAKYLKSIDNYRDNVIKNGVMSKGLDPYEKRKYLNSIFNDITNQ